MFTKSNEIERKTAYKRCSSTLFPMQKWLKSLSSFAWLSNQRVLDCSIIGGMVAQSSDLWLSNHSSKKAFGRVSGNGDNTQNIDFQYLTKFFQKSFLFDYGKIILLSGPSQC